MAVHYSRRKRPKIGADFLQNFELLVDLKKQKLLDPTTLLKAGITVSKGSANNIVTVKSAKMYSNIFNLLRKYNEFMFEYTTSRPIPHYITHHIVTNGPPIFSNVKRL